MNSFLRQLLVWLALAVMLVLFLTMLTNSSSKVEKLDRSGFLDAATRGDITKVDVTKKEDGGISFEGTYTGGDKAGKRFKYDSIELWDGWRDDLEARGVFDITEKVKQPSWAFILLLNVLPILLIIGLFWFFAFRPMQAGGNKAMSFGKSRAKLHQQTDKKVTFKDVAGAEEAK
ncbi:MAG: hypothetical protein J7M12_05675, partial [Candidatus Hydrogenedentes bacterium]|nr:hypothetical protein [Candidatus Hydrogenedentota bacterium]